MHEIDSLASFYLGKIYDEVSQKLSEEYLFYDTKDLTTHAMLVGMTGSGKTGLGISLLEEAALDNIPALIIDPKGDMTNLMLNFPNLEAEDFLPWVSGEEAQRKELTREALAASKAESWRNGLADWGINTDRLQRLKKQTLVRVYTPGSTAGIPISLLRSIALPSENILLDQELLNEYASSTVSALLTLLGEQDDPVNSREHILLNTILLDQWAARKSLTLPELIQHIQKPQVKQFGVLSLETFFPEKDRMQLAMKINNLLANPQFSLWMQGVPLDIDKFLFDEDGKPCLSIFSIHHLNDEERMFFVSSFLNAVLSWVRSQSGTSSLRALLYMDEIFGYFPPVSNPPSKKPLLTLLKQARAYGLGLVLSTQNPVDLDYKGLSNIGSWFIGRLQTQQDKDRLLAGLESASAENARVFDRQTLNRLLSSLPSRVFLMNNVHEDGPVLFHSRWAMSYLAGPLSRQQIARLDQPKLGDLVINSDEGNKVDNSGVSEGKQTEILERAEHLEENQVISLKPTLAEGIQQYFMPVTRLEENMFYLPSLLGIVDTTFVDKKHEVNTINRSTWNTPIGSGIIKVDWEKTTGAELDVDDLEEEGRPGLGFSQIPDEMSRKSTYTAWEKALKDYVYRENALKLYWSPLAKMVSREGESKSSFVQRIQLHAREIRDQAIEELRLSYQQKMTKLEERIRTAEQKVEREKSQANQAKLNTAISIGSTILGTFFGRKGIGKGTVGKAATSARAAGRARQQGADVEMARETLEKYRSDYELLEKDLQKDLEILSKNYEEESNTIEDFSMKPKKADINVRTLAVLWLPYEKREDRYFPCYRVSSEVEEAK